jgi:serine protease AprX
MPVVEAHWRNTPSVESRRNNCRARRYPPAWGSIALSLALALMLLVPAWAPNTAVRAPVVSASLGGVGDNIAPELKTRMAAAPTQFLPIIVELKPLPAPFPPRENELLAQHALSLLTQFGVPVGGLALIGSAAGWATSTGITSISLDPQVAYIHFDATVHVSTTPPNPYGWQVPLSTAYPPAVDADRVWWQQGLTGTGTAVAVLDSGVIADPDLSQPTNRLIAAVNLADDRGGMADAGGHGSHVAGIIGGNGSASIGEYVGIAPGVNLVDVRVLGRNGAGRISSVVRGIEWALAHRTVYNIRLINLSLGMPALPSYRANPLDAAVEIAWLRGVAVVAAAGNGGPNQGTVDAPGDDPYVITVGATDDSGTPRTSDDVLAWYSSWGTPAGSTAKPDVVAPGRRIVSIRAPGSYLDTHYPDRVTTARSGATYFRLSGTSMATPVVTGAAALLLQQQSGLTPDKLKASLMGTTQGYGWAASGPVVPGPGADGSGLVDAWALTHISAQGVPTLSDPWRRQLQPGPLPVKQGWRPADTLARALYPILYGQPLTWKDPNYLGIPWNTLTWTNLAWDNLAWDNLAWDNLAWDNLAWDNLAWDNLAWDNLAWDNLAWDNLAWDSRNLD